MSQHPIDKLFQEGLGKHQASVPDSLWANIAADQEKKVKKAWNFKVAMFSASLLLIFLTGLFFFQGGQQPAVANHNTPLAEETSKVEHPANTLNSETPTASERATTTKSTSETNLSPVSTSLEVKNSVNTPAISSSLPNEETPPIPTEENKTFLNSQAIATPPATSAEQVANDRLYLTSVSTTPPLPEQSVRSAANVALVDPIMTLPLPLLAPYERDLPEVMAQTSKIITKRKKALEVDLLGGFAYAHQILSTRNEDNRSSLDAREISEFPSLSYLASLRFSYRLTNRISLRSGLNYGQIRNQFEYDQINNFGTDSVQTLLIRSSNRLRLLEVPFLLGFELPGKRFRLAINAGPMLNLSTKASGRYLLPNQQQPIRLEDDNIYRTNIGIGWQGSLTAAYDLGGGNSFLIEPTFKSYPRSFTTADYPLNERYWMAGLQIGLRHKIH